MHNPFNSLNYAYLYVCVFPSTHATNTNKKNKKNKNYKIKKKELYKIQSYI